MNISCAAATDRGRVKKNNEDAYTCDEDLGLFAVADGMGGYAAGEVASEIAIDVMREYGALSPPAGTTADLGNDFRFWRSPSGARGTLFVRDQYDFTTADFTSQPLTDQDLEQFISVGKIDKFCKRKLVVVRRDAHGSSTHPTLDS